MAGRLLAQWPMSTPGRLPDVDYSRDGWYFVTVCTHRRRRIFWGVAREIATRELTPLTRRFGGLALDSWNLLPDHIHIIFSLKSCAATLSAVVQAYKSITTREIKAAMTIDRVWQRGFYDRIIRNEIELTALREYVQLNVSHHRRV